MAVLTPTPYATLTDLVAYGLTAQTATTISSGIQQAALDAANALADSYLGGHYRLPLTSWSKDLTSKVCHIAAYDAVVVRGANPDAPGVELLRDRWIAAIDWFKGIAKGDIAPNVVDSSSGGVVGGPYVESVSTDQASGNFVVGTPVSGRGW